MIVCRKGIPEEYEDIIDFINYVFSQKEAPHDFKKLLPKLYADGRNYAPYHYIIKEDEKIKAVICALPMKYQTPKDVLNAYCIGMVSVHPYARGKGYMKQLMEFVIEDLRSQGCSYLFLGGQRQRYEYFGFTPSGVQLDFTVTSTNTRHYLRNIDHSDVKLVPLTEASLLDKAYSLYEVQPYRVQRSREDFYDLLCSWESRPYAVIKEGNFVGSLVLRPDGTITELFLNDTTAYPLVLEALFSGTEQVSYTFLAASSELNKINFFMDIAESWRISTIESYRIFDFKAVILTFLNIKSELELLPNGSLVLRIDGMLIEITVQNNVPSILTSTKTADLSLTALEATALLFSYAGEFKLKQYAEKLSANKRICIKHWFPLPLITSQNDCC